MTRTTLSIALSLLAACSATPEEPGCVQDSECTPGFCVDEMCVDRSDASVDATSDTDMATDAGADVATDVALDSPPLDAAFADVPVRIGEWILSIDNREDNTVHALIRISVAEEDYGAVTVICDDVTLPPSLPSPNILSSLTFNRNILYASGRGAEAGDTLMIVDPCECTATLVGSYGYAFVAGITSNTDADMFGISGRQSVIFDIDPATALGTLIRELEVDWTTVGLTAASGEGLLWAISGATDELVLFSEADGTVVQSVPLSFDFVSVGMEYHPGVDKIFACSSGGELLVVDPATGNVDVGPVFAPDGCNNLAAPFGSVDCVL